MVGRLTPWRAASALVVGDPVRLSWKAEAGAFLGIRPMRILAAKDTRCTVEEGGRVVRESAEDLRAERELPALIDLELA